MSDRDALLRAIAANPNDDTPRLIYADLLDELGGDANGARARFIRLQIETHRGPGDTGGTFAFERKRDEGANLAKRYHREWLRELPTWCNPLFGLLGSTPADLFARGFIERVSTKAKPLALRGADLFGTAPIQTLELQGGSASLLPAVFGCFALARLRVLAVRWRNVSEELATALAGCPSLPELTELDLSGCWFGERGVRILSRSDRLTSLRVIRVSGDFLTAAAVHALAASEKLVNLRELDLRGCGLLPGVLAALRAEFPSKFDPRLTHLHLRAAVTYHSGMLRELAVQNLALIEDVRVELHAGFCAWTGETGAGKSLLLGALGLLLGERGSADLIRTGADDLRVTGRFELTRPEQRAAAAEMLQTTIEDDDLILTRRLSRSGRSSALVNDVPVAVATLKRIGEMLVDVHGQRESYSLLQPAYQLELLDAFGKLTDQRAKFVARADRVRELRRQFKELSEAKQTRHRELALVRFEREDIDAAKLTPGELPTLAKERERLVHAQSLALFTNTVAARLSDDDGAVVEVLAKLIKDSLKWAGFDPKLAEVSRRLDALRPEIEDLADTCRDLAEGFEADPDRLEEVEKRLAQLKKLQQRYGKTLDELVAYRDTLDAKEAELQKQEDDLSGIGAALRAAYSEMRDAATVLSKARAKVAKKLAADAQKHLADLGMPRAKLDAALEPIALPDDPMAGDVPAAGIDQLELILTANPGEPARPLRKVASGGELSRTMLALKTVLAAHDPVRTLVVFDEIDANVGGRLGDVLGQKLAALGRSHQVLCVTHLPQVASYAAHQWTIRKTTTAKRTATTITPLTTDDGRIEELALMLRGESRSETTRKEAAEMLTTAQKQRGP